jgi:hypothetical protein
LCSFTVGDRLLTALREDFAPEQPACDGGTGAAPAHHSFGAVLFAQQFDAGAAPPQARELLPWTLSGPPQVAHFAA